MLLITSSVSTKAMLVAFGTAEEKNRHLSEEKEQEQQENKNKDKSNSTSKEGNRHLKTYVSSAGVESRRHQITACLLSGCHLELGSRR